MNSTWCLSPLSPESVVVGKTAGDCSKTHTLRELISIACEDDFDVAMFADMAIHVPGFNLVPDIVVKTDSAAKLYGEMVKSKCDTDEQCLSARISTLIFSISK